MGGAAIVNMRKDRAPCPIRSDISLCLGTGQCEWFDTPTDSCAILSIARDLRLLMLSFDKPKIETKIEPRFIISDALLDTLNEGKKKKDGC